MLDIDGARALARKVRARWNGVKAEALRRAARSYEAARGVPAPTAGAMARALMARFAELSPDERRELFAWSDERMDTDELTVVYAERIFEAQRRDIERGCGPLRGLRVLELGPGHTLAGGALFALHGAGRYVAVDLFPVAARDAATYRRLRRHLAERPLPFAVEDATRLREEALRRFDELVRFEGETVVFDDERIAYDTPVDAARLPYPDASFDVVMSNAAFEHFSDPLRAIAECTRVLAPGGVHIHQIDLRDHRDFSRPLEFLQHSDEEWRAMNTNLFCYTNRMRKSDFERAFVDAGNELVHVDVNIASPAPTTAERARFHPRFRDLPDADLEALSAKFFVRRTAPLPAVRAARLEVGSSS